MEFWTQLFSEWPAVFNALGLVPFGGSIAASALKLPNTQWASIAVPLFALLSTLIQFIGFSC